MSKRAKPEVIVFQVVKSERRDDWYTRENEAHEHLHAKTKAGAKRKLLAFFEKIKRGEWKIAP